MDIDYIIIDGMAFNFYPLLFIKMNLKKLKQAFIILKSQKLIKYYEIEIHNKENKLDKIYKTFFIDYNNKSYFINFSYIRNMDKTTSDLKELIYSIIKN